MPPRPWSPRARALACLVACAAACAVPVARAQYVVPASEQAATVERHAAAWEVLVTNERSGDLTVLDGTTREVVETIPVGKRPRGIRVSPDGRFAYVALSGSPIPPPAGARRPKRAKPDRRADGIAIVDLLQRKVVRVLPGGVGPEELALDPAGRRLYVANEDANAATIVRADGLVEATVAVGREPGGVGIDADGRRAYVTCGASGDVHVIDAAARGVVQRIATGGRPCSIALTPDRTRALVASESTGRVSIVSLADGAVLRTLVMPAGAQPVTVILSHDGRWAFVSNGDAGTVSILELGPDRIRATIPVGARPWGMALSPDERWLYTANGPSNDVGVVDVAARRLVAHVPAGDGPWGVAVVRRP